MKYLGENHNNYTTKNSSKFGEIQDGLEGL